MDSFKFQAPNTLMGVHFFTHPNGITALTIYQPNTYKETMVEDIKTNADRKARISFKQERNLDNRREKERRKKPSPGFTYISTVGWIDRREKLRRKDDPYNF